MTTLLLLGATGLVGRCALRQALADERVQHLVAPTRRPLPAHAKLENPLLDYEHLPEDVPWWSVDAALCALGTTLRQAGSLAARRRVDHDYPLAVARLVRGRGARAFALTSAMGAHPRSRIDYSRNKGELEQALKALDFPSLTLVRPGMIGGSREQPRRGEKLIAGLLGRLEPVLPRRYRLVPAERIAWALLRATIEAPAGVRIVESEAI